MKPQSPKAVSSPLVEVLPYEPRHRDGVRALLSKAYGTAASFDRLEEGNPLGRFLGICAVRGDRVVGINIWNPWLVHTVLGPIEVFQSGASIVDESCRGQGVFGQLLAAGEREARARGIRYFVGFPNPASHGSFVRAGWETVRSLTLFLCTSPALGGRSSGATPPRVDSATWRFISWRYARSGATSVVTAIDGERFTAFFTTTVRRGLKIHRLLDVVNTEGQRDLRHVDRLARRLPGAGMAYLRASVPQSSALPGVPWLVPVRRAWDTPFILKVLDATNPGVADAVRGAALTYGDIDVE